MDDDSKATFIVALIIIIVAIILLSWSVLGFSEILDTEHGYIEIEEYEPMDMGGFDGILWNDDDQKRGVEW